MINVRAAATLGIGFGARAMASLGVITGAPVVKPVVRSTPDMAWAHQQAEQARRRHRQREEEALILLLLGVTQ